VRNDQDGRVINGGLRAVAPTRPELTRTLKMQDPLATSTTDEPVAPTRNPSRMPKFVAGAVAPLCKRLPKGISNLAYKRYGILLVMQTFNMTAVTHRKLTTIACYV
jgi:hypothetical protein